MGVVAEVTRLPKGFTTLLAQETLESASRNFVEASLLALLPNTHWSHMAEKREK